jgi:ribosomal protein L7/L12
MIRNIETAILVTRILADNGLGGRQLERAAAAIVALGDVEPSTVLADWEKELLNPGSTAREWCRLNLDSYRDDNSVRKIAMIKDCKALFSLTLKGAKDFVDEAVTNSDLARLREKLTGTDYTTVTPDPFGPVNPDPFGYRD